MLRDGQLEIDNVNWLAIEKLFEVDDDYSRNFFTEKEPTRYSLSKLLWAFMKEFLDLQYWP